MSGHRHVEFTLSGKGKHSFHASLQQASLNTLPFDNENPELGKDGIATAGKPGLLMFFLDGVLFTVSAQQGQSGSLI